MEEWREKSERYLRCCGRQLKLVYYPDAVERENGVKVTGSTLWDAGLALGRYAEKERPKLLQEAEKSKLQVHLCRHVLTPPPHVLPIPYSKGA